MNMLYEGLKEKGALMLVPSSAVESMGMGGLMGAAALAAAAARRLRRVRESQDDVARSGRADQASRVRKNADTRCLLDVARSPARYHFMGVRDSWLTRLTRPRL